MEENSFFLIKWGEHFENLLATTDYDERVPMAVVPLDVFQETNMKELPDAVDPTKPQRIHLYCSARHVTAGRSGIGSSEQCNKEYMGIKQHCILETAQMEKGMKLIGMTTRTEYKVLLRYPASYSASAR